MRETILLNEKDKLLAEKDNTNQILKSQLDVKDKQINNKDKQIKISNGLLKHLMTNYPDAPAFQKITDVSKGYIYNGYNYKMNKLGKLFIEEKPVHVTKEDKNNYNDDVNKFVENLKEKLNNVKEEKDKKERAEKLDDLFRFIVDNKRFLNIQEKQFCDLKKI